MPVLSYFQYATSVVIMNLAADQENKTVKHCFSGLHRVTAEPKPSDLSKEGTS